MSGGIQRPLMIESFFFSFLLMVLILSTIPFHPGFSSCVPICGCALVWLSAHVWLQVPRGSSLSLPNGSERALQSLKDPEDLQLPPCF